MQLLPLCEDRMDNWSNEVLGRINMVDDLVAVDAVYHQDCSIQPAFVPLTVTKSKGLQHTPRYFIT